MANPRVHGTLKVAVSERFQEEQPHLHPLAPERFDIRYHESGRVVLDAFIDVQGNLYSVPANLCRERVVIHRTFYDGLKVFKAEGWSVVPEHRGRLWQDVGVQVRDLTTYEKAIHRVLFLSLEILMTCLKRVQGANYRRNQLPAAESP